MISKNSIFSHFVFGKIATCIKAAHVMYRQEGKVSNWQFNHNSQQVLIYFLSSVNSLPKVGMEEGVKLTTSVV
jgi:hypothetical protein